MWKYNINSKRWTWLKGDSADISVNYGIQNSFDPGNKPGAREGSVSWKDNSGNLWFFGGYGYAENSFGHLNDLWEYNILSNEWAWVGGQKKPDTVGVFGTKNIPGMPNNPGGLAFSVSWIDNSNNLWLLGGEGNDPANNFGLLNDLWKYNLSNKQWAWIKGDSLINFPASYGVQGFISEGNGPGAREGSVSWKDGGGNLWLFGGYLSGGFGNYITGNNYFNDLWKFNPEINQWVWVNGDNYPNITGSYGVKGVSNSLNNPGSRSGSVSWIDASGNFYLFGGIGYDANGTVGFLNDLWKYNPSSNQWVWISGSNTSNINGIYGTMGVLSGSNSPGARYNAVSWSDGSGNLWLFGGNGYPAAGSTGLLNDLWSYNLAANEWVWI